jgi:putative membrane protein
MLLRLLLRWVLLAVIVGIVTNIVSGIHVSGGFGSLLWIALLLSVVNLIIGTLLRLITLPIILLTLGLFLLVVNALVLEITAGLSSDLSIDSFGSAVLGGLLIAVFGWVAELVLPLRRRGR